MTNNALEAAAPRLGRERIDFAKVGGFLVSAFKDWLASPEPRVSVRLFESLTRNAFGLPQGNLNAGSQNIAANIILETDGQVCLDPDFWQITRFSLGKLSSRPGHRAEMYNMATSVHDRDFALETVAGRLKSFTTRHELTSVPGACQRCTVRSICRGSHPASRYGEDGSFLHRSAYCEAMYRISEEILRCIVDLDLASSLVDVDLRRHMTRDSVTTSRNDTRETY